MTHLAIPLPKEARELIESLRELAGHVDGAARAVKRARAAWAIVRKAIGR